MKNYENPSTFVKVTAKKNQWHLFFWTRCISKHAFPIMFKILCANGQKASASGGLLPPDSLPGLCPWTPLGLPSPDPPDWPVFILGLSGGTP